MDNQNTIGGKQIILRFVNLIFCTISGLIDDPLPPNLMLLLSFPKL